MRNASASLRNSTSCGSRSRARAELGSKVDAVERIELRDAADPRDASRVVEWTRHRDAPTSDGGRREPPRRRNDRAHELVPRRPGCERITPDAGRIDRPLAHRNDRGGHVRPADLERAHEPERCHATNAFTTFAGEPPVRVRANRRRRSRARRSSPRTRGGARVRKRSGEGPPRLPRGSARGSGRACRPPRRHRCRSGSTAKKSSGCRPIAYSANPAPLRIGVARGTSSLATLLARRRVSRFANA